MLDFSYIKKTSQFQLIIESIDALCSIDKIAAETTHQTKREKEIEAKKILMDQLYPKAHLSYNRYGAPQLSNGKAISFSHSRELLAVISADKLSAVDIEPISNKAFRIRHKFLSQMELKLVTNNKVATLLWCAKECLYKIHQKGNVIFKKDLRIHQLTKNQLKCSVLDKTYLLNYEKFKEHWLVYYFD